jgi:tRNA(Ile)-lysidine synthase
MIARGDSILVAASGGPDSTALLHALDEIGRKKAAAIAVAHLHHGLRGREADRDADFAARQAASLGLDFYSEHVDAAAYRRRHRLSTEEAARRLRYDFLLRTAERRSFSKIALGHNADDNAESVLMFLFRGAGPRGLAGISPRQGRFIRPLIELPREEIRSFLARRKIPFVLDSTNADLRFVRNRIRHELIPHLTAAYNPNLIETLLRHSKVIGAEEKWLEALTAERFEEALLFRDPDRVELSVSQVAAFDKAACRRVLRKAVAELTGDLRRIGFRHIEAIRRMVIQKKGSGEIALPRGVRAVRCYDRLSVRYQRGEPSDAPSDFSVLVNGPGHVRIPGRSQSLRLTLCASADAAEIARSGHRVVFFDMGKLDFPVTVRNLRPGDRFRPLGMTGTQKVSDFFVNRKVPRQLRWTCPVLVSGGNIAWVVGHRMAEDFRAGPEARQVLRGELLAEAD